MNLNEFLDRLDESAFSKIKYYQDKKLYSRFYRIKNNDKSYVYDFDDDEFDSGWKRIRDIKHGFSTVMDHFERALEWPYGDPTKMKEDEIKKYTKLLKAKNKNSKEKMKLSTTQEGWFQDIDDNNIFYYKSGSTYKMYDSDTGRFEKVDKEYFMGNVVHAKEWKHGDPTKMSEEELEELM
jgi:hypothetical protein